MMAINDPSDNNVRACVRARSRARARACGVTSGQRSHWFIESPMIFYPCETNINKYVNPIPN